MMTNVPIEENGSNSLQEIRTSYAGGQVPATVKTETVDQDQDCVTTTAMDSDSVNSRAVPVNDGSPVEIKPEALQYDVPYAEGESKKHILSDDRLTQEIKPCGDLECVVNEKTDTTHQDEKLVRTFKGSVSTESSTQLLEAKVKLGEHADKNSLDGYEQDSQTGTLTVPPEEDINKNSQDAYEQDRQNGTSTVPLEEDSAQEMKRSINNNLSRSFQADALTVPPEEDKNKNSQNGYEQDRQNGTSTVPPEEDSAQEMKRSINNNLSRSFQADAFTSETRQTQETYNADSFARGSDQYHRINTNPVGGAIDREKGTQQNLFKAQDWQETNQDISQEADSASRGPQQTAAPKRKHTSTYDNKCEVCEQTFEYTFQLKEHALIHKKKRQGYRKYSVLLKQIRKKSGITKKDMFQCAQCELSFMFVKDLIKHEKFHKDINMIAKKYDRFPTYWPREQPIERYMMQPRHMFRGLTQPQETFGYLGQAQDAFRGLEQPLDMFIKREQTEEMFMCLEQPQNVTSNAAPREYMYHPQESDADHESHRVTKVSGSSSSGTASKHALFPMPMCSSVSYAINFNNAQMNALQMKVQQIGGPAAQMNASLVDGLRRNIPQVHDLPVCDPTLNATERGITVKKFSPNGEPSLYRFQRVPGKAALGLPDKKRCPFETPLPCVPEPSNDQEKPAVSESSNLSHPASLGELSDIDESHHSQNTQLRKPLPLPNDDYEMKSTPHTNAAQERCFYDQGLFCLYCGALFLTEMRLRLHIESRECLPCSEGPARNTWEEKKRQKLSSEMNISEGEYSCYYCLETFKTGVGRSTHERVHVRQLQHNERLKRFAMQDGTESMPKDDDTDLFEWCVICDTAFVTFEKMNSHFKTHWPKKCLVPQQSQKTEKTRFLASNEAPKLLSRDNTDMPAPCRTNVSSRSSRAKPSHTFTRFDAAETATGSDLDCLPAESATAASLLTGTSPKPKKGVDANSDLPPKLAGHDSPCSDIPFLPRRKACKPDGGGGSRSSVPQQIRRGVGLNYNTHPRAPGGTNLPYDSAQQRFGAVGVPSTMIPQQFYNFIGMPGMSPQRYCLVGANSQPVWNFRPPVETDMIQQSAEQQPCMKTSHAAKEFQEEETAGDGAKNLTCPQYQQSSMMANKSASAKFSPEEKRANSAYSFRKEERNVNSTPDNQHAENDASYPQNKSPENPRSLQCVECGLFFSSKAKLHAHFSATKLNGPLTCDSCSRTFHCVDAMTIHIETHKPQKRLYRVSCSQPSQSSLPSSPLPKRSQRASGLRDFNAGKDSETLTFKCSLCVEVFDSMRELRRHRLTHYWKNPRLYEDLPVKIQCFVCPHCPSVFEHRSHLENHIRIHAAGVFACYLCGRTFVDSTALAQHVATHKTSE